MLKAPGMRMVIGAFRSALLSLVRKEHLSVLAKARPIYDEVIASLEDFGPKLSIGKTPDCYLVSYSMLRSDYDTRLEELTDAYPLYKKLLEDEYQ
jgi:hypothetical protein